MKRLLITGESGFVGRNFLLMADRLRQEGAWNPLVAQHPYDLNAPDTLDTLLTDTQPDAVVHLAGLTFVPDSFARPADTLQTNLIGTLHVLQALDRHAFEGSFLFVSSGDVYGRLGEQSLPVRETHQLNPTNPYAVSKIAAEALCRQWALQARYRIVIARPFNHIGPGQREDFVIASMARQIVDIRRGRQEAVIQTGDIDVTRDFLDVRDVIGAYLALLAKGEAGEIYNVCSGRGRTVRSLIERMIALAGIDARLETDPSRLRRAEQREVIGCNAKLVAATGWQAQHDLDQTLNDNLEDWEQRIS